MAEPVKVITTGEVTPPPWTKSPLVALCDVA